ncbi:nitronate monooxygenase [bacterium]|nr:nitronate monooxygenase [bacterium]
MNSRITKLFGIKYPIIQGGMIWVSGWKLATSVSRAGGLGLIGAGSMKSDVLTMHIRKAKAAWNGPIGVNLPLMRMDSDRLVDIIIDEGIKIVFTSAGNPAKYTKRFQSANIVVVHVVPSLKFGLKAADSGVDAIVGEGTEAGGHNGFEEIPTFPLIQRLADHIDIPIIAAGGIRDGRGLAAARALGADGVQIGTRFACCTESSASDLYKAAIVESKEPATFLGLKKLGPTRMLINEICEELRNAELSGADRASQSLLKGVNRARKGIFEGDTINGFLEAGEIAGDINEIQSAETIIQEIVMGYQATIRKLSKTV